MNKFEALEQLKIAIKQAEDYRVSVLWEENPSVVMRAWRTAQASVKVAMKKLEEATVNKANIWDGVGPERGCLLRVRWNNSDDAEWIQFDFQSADGEYTEDGLVGNRDRYRNESATLYVTDVVDYGPNRYESKDFTVTHWAEIPEVIP